MTAPPWRYTVDLKEAWKAADENGKVFQLIEVVVARLTGLRNNVFKEDDDLDLFIDDFNELLSDAEDTGIDIDKNDFDEVWAAFYDWADANRVWVKIH